MASRGEALTKLRVLRVVTRLNVGGPALHVALLTTGLDPQRFETLLVAGQEGRREGSMLDLGRIGTHVRPMRVPELGRSIAPAGDLRALWRISRLVRSYRPHIVHTHLAKAGFVGRVAARLSGVPVVVHTYHGSVFRGYFGREESALYLNIERLLGRLTTRVIAITPGQRRELIELGIAPAERVVEIPLGLDLEPFHSLPHPAEARRRMGLEDRPTVGIVARLVRIKDVATFLRAIALLASNVADVQAVVVGDGEEREALERLASELGLAKRCRFLGWQRDMPTVYACLDVVALTSLNEGSPVTVIEALAARRPVVATAVGGVPDVVRDGANGLLVPPRDPAALADALAELLAHPDVAERYALVGQSEMYARYTGQRLVSDMQRLYLDLVASSPAWAIM